MANDRTSDHYQGILIPDERVCHANLKSIGAGATDSSYTQASPVPGVPTPDQSTDMALEASGTCDDRDLLEIYTKRAGNPGPEEAGFLYRLPNTGHGGTGDTTAQYKGWDGYQLFTGWETVNFSEADGLPENWLDAIRLKSGKILVGAQPPAPGGTKLYLYRFDPDTSAWSELELTATTHIGPLGLSSIRGFGLCELPSGRVLLFMESINDNQIDVYRSDDEGTTWVVHALRVLDTPIYDDAGAAPTAVKQIKAAYNNGEICLLVCWLGDTPSAAGVDISQYASSDKGGHFTQIERSIGSLLGAAAAPQYPSIQALPGGGFLAGIFWRANTGYRAYKAASAYDRLTDNFTSAVSATVVGNEDAYLRGASMWLDEDGIVYWLVSNDTVSPGKHQLVLYRSTDYGETWELFTYQVFDTTDDEITFFGFSCMSSEGRTVMITRNDTTAEIAAAGPSINALWLGGHGDHTAPTADADVGDDFSDVDHVSWGVDVATLTGFAASWVPLDAPDNMGWTAAGAGTGSLVDPYAWDITTTAAQSLTYTQSAASEAGALFAKFEIDIDDGDGDYTTDEIAFKVRVGDASTYEYEASIRMQSDGFQVYDVGATAVVGGTVSVDLTAYTRFRVVIGGSGAADGHILVWTCTDAHAAEWTLQVDEDLADIAAHTGQSRVVWGHLANGDNTSRWTQAGMTDDAGRWSPEYEDDPWASWTNPTDLHPRSFPTLPAGVDDGFKIRAASGPTKLYDTWQIAAASEYGIENIDPRISPSPRRQWRSTNDDSELDIVWDLESLFSDSRWENAAMGIALINCNFRLAYLEEYVGAAWASIIDIDTASGWTGMDYNRYGRIFEAKAGGSTPPYLFAQEHEGDTFDISADVAADPVRIAQNTGGMWVASGGPIARITANADDLTGAEGATGRNAMIWRRNYAAVVYQEASTPALIRLRIPAQTTATGDFRIGAVVIGPVAIFGHQYDRGYKWRKAHNSPIITATDGTRRSRVDGPPRRSFEFAWTETAVDQTTMYLSTPDADYVTGTSGGGGLPIGAKSDTPRMVDGVISRLGGADVPVAMLGKLTPQTGDGTGTDHITDTTTWLYGRLTSNPEIDVILGDEGDDEVHRLNTITVEEEV